MSEVISQAARLIHIVAGSVALVSIWLPLIGKKGSRLHRRIGWVFAIAMGVVTASALVRCALVLTEHGAGRDRAFLLGYLAVLSAEATWQGIRALRARRSGAHPLDAVPAMILAASAVAALAFGLIQRAPLFVIFGGLGLIIGGVTIRFWRRPPTTAAGWILAHLNAMIGASAAAVTAFTVVNAGRLGLSTAALAAWVAPGVVFSVIGAMLRRPYRRAASRRQASAI